MSRGKDLIPVKDEDFDQLQRQLLQQVTLNGVAWSISPAEVLVLTTAQGPWTTSWNAYKPMGTRSPVLRAAKDDTRKKYVNVLRPFIQKNIRRNALLSDVNVVACGLKPIDRIRTRSSVPDTVPFISCTPGHGNSVVVHFRLQSDEEGHSQRALPKGISRCEFVFMVGTTPPLNADECNRSQSATRNPMHLSFDPTVAGQRLYIFGRWINTRNQPGGWGIRKEIIIPG